MNSLCGTISLTLSERNRRLRRKMSEGKKKPTQREGHERGFWDLVMFSEEYFHVRFEFADFITLYHIKEKMTLTCKCDCVASFCVKAEQSSAYIVSPVRNKSVCVFHITRRFTSQRNKCSWYSSVFLSFPIVPATLIHDSDLVAQSRIMRSRSCS